MTAGAQSRCTRRPVAQACGERAAADHVPMTRCCSVSEREAQPARPVGELRGGEGIIPGVAGSSEAERELARTRK